MWLCSLCGISIINLQPIVYCHSFLQPWNEAQKRLPKNVSVASTTNERYALDAPSSHDHVNEDEYLVDESSDSSSVYLCVLDGHDGRNAVEFVKTYLWDNIQALLQLDNPADAMRRCIRDADTKYFKRIDPLFVEKFVIQSKIPKVIVQNIFVQSNLYVEYLA